FAVHGGKPAVALVVSLEQQARAREVSAAVRKKLTQLGKRFPKGVAFSIPFDFTPSLVAPPGPAAPEWLLLDVSLPASASPERVRAALDRCGALLRRLPGVQDVLALSDNPFDGIGDRPCLLVGLAPAGKRGASRERLVQAVREQFKQVPE